MTYPAAIEYLYRLQQFGAKLGLEQTRLLAAKAGNPQDRLRFIHVAGTNGKGSVCAMLDNIYRLAGLRVGLFTSPHLVAFGERIQVDRHPIPDADIARLTSRLQPWIESFPSGRHPTFFEAVTVLALLYFAEQRCDLVIWETGLGGRLDATNIVTPLAAIITNVALDHEKWLGPTLPAIAREKAGIVKPSVPVIHGVRDPACRDILIHTAQTHQSPLTDIHDPGIAPALADFLAATRLSLGGQHQRDNAALALACVRVLQAQVPVPEATVRRGLETTVWAGRLQRVQRGPRQLLLLDGAHNQAGCEALVQALRQDYPGQRPTVIWGALADKDFASMGRTLTAVARRICVVPIKSMHSASPDQLAAVCRQTRPELDVSVHPSLEDGWARAASDVFILITGSIYLIGEAMQLLAIAPERPADEMRLNAWGPPLR